MNLTRKIWTLIAILLLPVLAVGCHRNDAQHKELKIGGPPNLSILPLIAIDQGQFSNQRVNVQYQTIQTAKLTLDAVVAGSIDVGVTVDANIASAALNGSREFRIIAISQIKRDDGIAAIKAKGISKPGDLRGKSIGYVPGTTSDVFLSRLLKANGLSKLDVTLVSSTPPALQPAMDRGDLDAVSIWQPFRSNILASKPGIIEFRNNGEYSGTVFLVARADTLVSKREAILDLIAGLRKAEQFAHTNTTQAIAVAARRINIPVEKLTKIWGDYDLVIQPPQRGSDAILQAYSSLDPAGASKAGAAEEIAELIDSSILKQ